MKMKGIMDVQEGQDEEGYRLAKLPLPAGEGWGEGERIPHFLASIETGC
jgi:hypothetical protein